MMRRSDMCARTSFSIIFAKKDDSQLEPDTSANHSDSHTNNNSSRSITPVNWIHRPCVTTKTLNKCFTLRMENRARRKKKAPRSGNCWTLSLNDGSPGSIHSGWKRKLYSVRSFEILLHFTFYFVFAGEILKVKNILHHHEFVCC